MLLGVFKIAKYLSRHHPISGIKGPTGFESSHQSSHHCGWFSLLPPTITNMSSVCTQTAGK